MFELIREKHPGRFWLSVLSLIGVISWGAFKAYTGIFNYFDPQFDEIRAAQADIAAQLREEATRQVIWLELDEGWADDWEDRFDRMRESDRDALLLLAELSLQYKALAGTQQSHLIILQRDIDDMEDILSDFRAEVARQMGIHEGKHHD